MKRRTWLWIVAVIILIVAGWQFYKYRIVRNRVATLVEQKSKGLYSLHYEDLLFDEVSGNLRVKNVDIIPDTAVYNQMVKDNTNPSVLVSLHLPELRILRIK